MSELLPTELTVTVGDETYMFAIPTIRDEAKIGMRTASIRRSMLEAGEQDPGPQALDFGTNYTLRACAVFELQLRKASVTWPFSQGKNGPVVDSTKFPLNKSEKVLSVYEAYTVALDTFRSGGNPDQPAPDAKVVAGEPDSGEPKPV